MRKDLANQLKMSHQTLKKLGQNYLTGNLRDYFQIQLIYVSSRFEGANVTRKEIETVIRNYPSSPRTKKPDILQAYGQKKALELIEKKVKEKDLIKVDWVPEIHKIILADIFEDRPGQFRTGPVKFRHTPFMTALPFMVPVEMQDFGDWLLSQQRKIDDNSVWEILEFATASHYRIVRIHPFIDGNGRVARIFFNLIMRHYNLPYVIIPKTFKDERLFEAFQAANQNDLGPLTNLFGELLRSSFNEVTNYYKVDSKKARKGKQSLRR